MSTSRRFTRKKARNSPLRTSYGSIFLPKGTILYQVSGSYHCDLPDPKSKPILFMTLHPSEWYTEDGYVSVIELQKDIDILFMINSIVKLKVYSALNSFLGKNGSNLAKMNTDNLYKWVPILQKEHLNGWFSSIENKMAVEFALINDPSIVKRVRCEPLRYNWTNSFYNNTFVPKNWGSLYEISTLKNHVTMYLNRRFASQIEEYIKNIEIDDKRGTAFSILLENAKISYFDAPIKEIRWSI